jgi:outer membrane immunogenic protein
MRKFLLGTVGLVAMAAPALAADLSVRPRLRPRNPDVQLVGFLHWRQWQVGSEPRLCGLLNGAGVAVAQGCGDRSEASSAASSVIAGKPASGCLAGSGAIGRISATNGLASSILRSTRTKTDGIGLFTGRSVMHGTPRCLLQGRRGGDEQPL